MADDVLLNKASTVERCVTRVRQEYEKGPATFGADFTRQDAAILNLQRACEAYQALQLPITLNIIEHPLGDFLAYTEHLLKRDSPHPPR